MAFSSSSSSSRRPMKHQVFLSFRGEDTRLNFTTHLLKALKRKGLDVFFDEEKLERGEELSPALSQAIAASNLAVIILSQDYASSKSCLAELSDVMDRKNNQGQIVLPIFYHVNPSDVQNLSGSFKASFDEHESKGIDQVQRLKAAFAAVGKLEGRHIEGGEFDRPETEHIKNIVECVIQKLMKHQVFLSFRGEDTGLSFTAHLLKALENRGINVLSDKGDQFSQAISVSNLSIIVLSINYASSKSCLAGLSEIMDQKDNQGLIVLPIFYHVDPSDVRNIGGSFKASFDDHESKGIDRVHQWKKTFARIGKLKGWHIEGSKFDRPDTEYIKDITEYAIKKLNRKSTDVSEDLVGIDDQKKVILGLVEQEDSRVIGLWGMGGIGKTTLADAVYNEISPTCQSRCFLQNVREGIKNKGMVSVRNELLSKLLDDKIQVDTPSIGSNLIKERLSNKRVIVVLDDVDDSEQIHCMGIKHFGDGSKIIVSSRDRQVLRNGGANKIHEVKKLKENDSLQLFATFAFKLFNPPVGFRDLSCKFRDYAQGSPLALKVLGSKLYRKSRKEWESEADKLKEYAQPQISQILKTSFDGLDELEKSIFLDIACFFKRESKEKVKEILSCLYKGAESGISNLVDKCLIDINYGYISMHDMLEEMGKDIVRQEFKVLEERSRLWSLKEVNQVSGYNKVNKSIEGIKVHMTETENIQLCPTIFENMFNLRYIDFCVPWRLLENEKILVERVDSVSLPNELKYLGWDFYPFKSLSPSLNPKNLVILKLWRGNMEQLWNEDHQDLVCLRKIDLTDCKNLRKIPNLLGAINLKSLDCSGCESLVELPRLTHLTSLQTLRLCHCTKLVELPCLDHLASLETLQVSVCKNLKRIPNLSGVIKLKTLDCASCKSLVELPSLSHLTSLEKLKLSACKNLRNITDLLGAVNLKTLDCRWCESLVELPCLSHLKSLECLLLCACKNLRKIPNLVETINLKTLDCRWCGSLIELPCLSHLTSLERLQLCACKNLRKIPDLSRAINLKTLDCRWCESLVELPCLSHLKSLECLQLRACKNLRKIPNLSITINLKTLDCRWCESLVELPCLSNLTSLEKLKLCACNSLRKIPDLSGAINLKTLDCRWCESLVELPYLSHLTSLERFNLCACKNLRKLPNLTGAISLKTLDCRWCGSLEELSCLSDLASLEWLQLCACKNLKKIPSLSGAIHLKILDCRWCESLVELPCLSDLASLEQLKFCACKNLKKISNLLGAIKLKTLDCRWCESLVELPCIDHLTSLETLQLSGCCNLEKFPELPNNVSELDLSFTGTEEVPDSIEHLFRA